MIHNDVSWKHLLILVLLHGQTGLLFDGLQLVRADGLYDQVELLTHGLVAVRHADVGHVGASDVVPFPALFHKVWAQPVALHLMDTDDIQISQINDDDILYRPNPR